MWESVLIIKIQNIWNKKANKTLYHDSHQTWPLSMTFSNLLSNLSCLHAATTAAKSLQSCPTLCDPIDGSPPGSPVPEILQARTLEWVAISFSNAWKWKVKVKSLSHVQLLATPWTASHQALPSMGFSRHEYWNGVPLPSPFSWKAPFQLIEFPSPRDDLHER